MIIKNTINYIVMIIKIIKFEGVCLNCINITNNNEGIFLLFYSDKVVFSLKQFKI